MKVPPGDRCAAIAGRLTSSLGLRHAPVAVCFSKEIPPGVGTYAGLAPAGCRFWQEGATATFSTSVDDHSRCAIGVYTHNLEQTPAVQTDLMDTLKVFAELGYVREGDLPLIPVLNTRPAHVIYAPLSEAPLFPDLVILFVDSSQTLILSEATQQVEEQTPPAMGRPACAIVPQVINSGRAALSLGCCGARAYLDILTNDIGVFAIPGDKLEAYTARIESLAHANSLLANFHQLRRSSTEGGRTPTIAQTLAELQASGGATD